MKRKNDHRAPGADPIAKLKGRRRRRAALAKEMQEEEHAA